MEQIYNLKFRIYPTAAQRAQFENCFGSVRFVYNHFVSEPFEGYAALCRKLTQLKREYSWLNEPPADILQQSLHCLSSAFTKFFKHQADFPKFHRKKSRRSFTTTGPKLTDRYLIIPKFEPIRIHLHRDISDFRIGRSTIIREPSGKYFVTLVARKEIMLTNRVLDINRSVGLDFHCTKFYVDSQDTSPVQPDYRAAEVKISHEQRKLSRMEKGGRNYVKQVQRVAALYEKLRNVRRNFLHILSHRLSAEFDYIFIEDLNLKEMSKEFGSYVHRESYSTFLDFLSYKLRCNEGTLVKVSRYFPSSQLCSTCGYRNHNLQLSDRTWTCPQCCTTHSRDHNAALNILAEGKRLVCTRT